MDNYFNEMPLIDALIGFVGGVLFLLAFLVIVVAVTDWLQDKLDELNRQVDNEQNEQQ